MDLHNANKTCWNCPAAVFKGNVDFRACGQSKEKIKELQEKKEIVIQCTRRPELGNFEPSITFEQCPEWVPTKYGYMLKDMRVMILGIDGYLGWALALKLGKLGCKISGVDNYCRRDCVMGRGSHSITPLTKMTERLQAAKEVHGIAINFRKIDINDTTKIKQFLEEVKPEAIVHYAEIPSAPYSMLNVDYAKEVQRNNVLGTLGLLHAIKDTVPESSLIKLGTMGEYGSPLTGRALFEGIFPADAVLKWRGREWSMGGELTPRDPISFYHVSKVQDTFNIYEACKYWWLRSYDIMQGVIYGLHSDELMADKRLWTRYDIDEWFGTVINRFVAQAVENIPLTIYGQGEQIRGFISLEDAMQCMCRLILSPPEPGQYDVVNQVSGLHKISDLAETVAKVGNEKFNLNVKIQKLENPRVEADLHPLEVVSSKLPKIFGFESQAPLEKEIERLFSILTKPEIKERISQKKHLVLPKTRWDGTIKKVETLEEYEAGLKKSKGYQGILDRD